MTIEPARYYCQLHGVQDKEVHMNSEYECQEIDFARTNFEYEVENWVDGFGNPTSPPEEIEEYRRA